MSIISKVFAVHAAIGLFAMATGAACTQPVESFSEHLLNRMAAPTPTAYYARTRQLIVGAGGDVKAVALQHERRVADGLLYRAPGDEVLRLRIDAQRDRLWILDVGNVHVFDLAKNRLIRSVALPNWFYAGHGTNCLPDLQLDRSGAAFVSNNIEPKLWRIDADNFSVRQHTVSLDSQRNVDAGFSALAITGSGELYAARAAPGSLWRIDRASFRAEQLPLSAPLHGACAIETQGATGSRASTLYVLVAGSRRFDVRRVDLVAGTGKAYVDLVSVVPVAAPAGLLARDGTPYLALHDVAVAPQRARTGSVVFSLRPIVRPY
jgi:hypothetical protein